MTDRELLELAAKAAGMDAYRYCPFWAGMALYNKDSDSFSGPTWNPLIDSGDALDLAVKLDLSSLVIFPSAGGKRREFWTPNSSYDGGKAATTEAEYEADPYAATRCAIVRAAAELGRSKE